MSGSKTASRYRPGTSISQFLEKFPDSEACLAHVFEVRFGASPPCPTCGAQKKWYRIQNTKRYSSNCCHHASIHPLSGTLFEKTNIPLRKWFYAIMLICNANRGISPKFLEDHLGISRKSAVRMADRIRQHFQAIDCRRQIGGPGKVVSVVEGNLGSVIDRSQGSRTSMRIISLCDDHDFAIVAVPKGRFANARRLVEQKVAPGSSLAFKQATTLAKLLGHKARRPALFKQAVVVEDSSDARMALNMTIPMALSSYVRGGHIWIGAENITRYIAQFEFLFRRRHDAVSAFLSAIGEFPSLPNQ